MRKVILAFESASVSARLKDVLESEGAFSCLVCHSAAEVKRTVLKLRISSIVCGFKLVDQTCEDLYHDLPDYCAMLMVSKQSNLDMCETPGIFQLPTPVHKGEFIASVRMLTQFQEQNQKGKRPARRSEEEQRLIDAAKATLMENGRMTEEEAHRYLQKRSMDNGAKLVDTAREILSGN